MRSLLTCLTLGIWLFVVHAPAWPILIETAPKKRVGGYLVQEDGKHISVRIKLPNGDEKVEVFDRSKVKIVHAVDRTRLEKLTREQPTSYRDYAEELARQKDDPEATALTFRLFLIAAYLDPNHLGRDCLQRMSELTTNVNDARRFRALAFSLDPRADPALLTEEHARRPVQAPLSKEAKEGLFYFRKAVRQYRNGQFNEAQANAKVAGVAPTFALAPDFMDQQTFIQACKNAQANKGLSPDQMDAAVRAEVWALDQMLGKAPAAKNRSSGWSRALHAPPLAPIRPLQLETITEFDPRQCVFRKGAWTVP